MRLYMDGQEEESRVTSVPAIPAVTGLHLGGTATGGGIEGAIDEFRISAPPHHRRRDRRALGGLAVLSRLQERAHAGLAQLLLVDGDPLQAITHAREAATFQTALAEGLDDSEIVDVGTQRNEVADIGIQASRGGG